MKTHTTIFAVIFYLVLSLPALAEAKSYKVKGPEATVFEEPDQSSKTAGKLKHDRAITAGENKNGFVKIQTKSGRSLWIKESDLVATGSELESDIAENKEAPQAKQFTPFLSYDLSGGAGSYNNKSYTEVELGFNWHWMDWLIWRNALFYRLVDPQNTYGLDTSLRAHISPSFTDALGVTLFAGPGYRFINSGTNAPFAEGGVILHVMGLNVGGGAKVILNSMVDSRLSNDTTLFIVLSGGGTL